MTHIVIVGTDTDVGKTVVTAALLHQYHHSPDRCSVVSQKWVDSGCEAGSRGDIGTHDHLSGLSFSKSLESLRSVYRLPFPASPHFSAIRASQSLDLRRMTEATAQLRRQFDVVLTEGSGGLMVPLTKTADLIDLLTPQDQIIVVVANRLGALNHALLSVHMLQQRSLPLSGLVLNPIDPDTDPCIRKNNQQTLQDRLSLTPILFSEVRHHLSASTVPFITVFEGPLSVAH